MADPTWSDFAPKAPPLANGMKWNVFLSYRSVNRPWVLNLYDELCNLDNSVFLDQVVLTGGQSLIMKLRENLNASQSGVLIWSSAAADSKWVQEEYAVMAARALEDELFHFVPIRIDDTPLPGFADTKIFFDFRSYPEGPNGGELLRLLHSLQGKALSTKAARFADDQNTLAVQATADVQTAIEIGNADKLIELFEQGGLPWTTTPVLAALAAEGLTKLEKCDEAIEMLESAESDFPRAIRLKQLRALALARRAGARDLDEAQQLVGSLYNQGHKDPETLGIYARTWKDRYAASGDANALRKSRDLYAEAFDGATDDYYTGINAASMSVILGTDADIAQGAEYAKRVEAIVGTQKVLGDYWQTATVAEVQLLQRNYAAARTLYADAVAIAPMEGGSHESSWKQACRLMKSLGATRQEIDEVAGAFPKQKDYDAIIAQDA